MEWGPTQILHRLEWYKNPCNMSYLGQTLNLMVGIVMLYNILQFENPEHECPLSPVKFGIIHMEPILHLQL